MLTTCGWISLMAEFCGEETVFQAKFGNIGMLAFTTSYYLGKQLRIESDSPHHIYCNVCCSILLI
jgi:hypothetical protein